MRKIKSHFLNDDVLINRYANAVTYMNLISHKCNASYIMSKSYFKILCDFHLIDKCDFNIQVSKHRSIPLYPVPMFNF